MTVLVDTCALLFALLSPDRLSARARSVLASRSSRLIWSAVSTWEVVIKARTGKLDLGGDVCDVLSDQLLRMGMQILPMGQTHALAVAHLPEVDWTDAAGVKRRHADPFDRMLVAQAMVEGLPILTADGHFADYPVQRIW